MTVRVALAALVVLPGLAGVVQLALARRAPRESVWAGVAGAGAALAIALVLVAGGPPGWTAISASLPVGDLSIPLAQGISDPGPVVALVVALVGLCVQLYAAWYLADDDRRGVFGATVSIFVAAMLLLVTSADLVLTLVGWEVMGWCSYLLIGHWSRREAPRRAAHKAFLVTRFADIGFVLGVVVLSVGAGTTSIPTVVAEWARSAGGWSGDALTAPGQPTLSIGLALLVIGVLGKSAQFPFQDWLPDAMEGPTPASALIHAATMVAAGTFVLAQLSPLLAVSAPARWVLTVSVAVTMVLAAVVALVQSDLKRMLAWSTVSQVAIMLSAVGAGARDSAAGAGVLHLFAHAFFKALLFLVIGWLGVVAGGTAVARLRGSALAQPLARIAFAVGLLALAGLPFLVGGTSKEHVLGSVLSAAGDGRPESVLAAAALLATVVLTAGYSTRAWLVVSTVPDHRSAQAAARVQRRHALATPDVPAGTVDGSTPLPVEHAPNAPNAGAQLAIGVLLAGTVLGSLVLRTDLVPGTGEAPGWLLLATLALIALGAAAGWLLRVLADRPTPSRLSVLEAGLGFDRAYRVLVAAPVLALARLVALADERVVDATARGSARLVDLSGARASAGHETERPATGLLWVLGAAAVMGLIGAVAWR